MSDEDTTTTGEEGVGTEPDKTKAADDTQDSSFSRVHIRPGKPFEIDQTTSIKYLSSLPVLSDETGEYVPMPYTFRVPGTQNRKITNVIGRSPPYHLQLDHTIAVIWLMFSERVYDSPLGIAQLQWALTFLKTIYNRQGEHPKDIELCIEAIEDTLIDEYADLSDELTKIKTMDETMHYEEGVIAGETIVEKDIPFSLNYSEMLDNCPPQTVTLFEASAKRSMTEEEINEELEKIKTAAGVDEVEKLDSVSREKYINYLNIWKSEQLEKVRNELKRLRSIEDMVKNVDADRFEGYIEDNNVEILFSKR